MRFVGLLQRHLEAQSLDDTHDRKDVTRTIMLVNYVIYL